MLDGRENQRVMKALSIFHNDMENTESLEILEGVLNDDPDNPGALAALGEYRISRDPTEGFSLIMSARELAPEDPVVIEAIGSLFLLDEDLAQGYYYFSTLIEKHPDYPYSYHFMGDIAFKMNDYESALENYLKALELFPTKYTHFNLALLYGEMGELEKAKSHYRKVIGLEKNYVPAYINLGGLAIKENDYDAAENFYTKACRIAPSDPSPLDCLGFLYGLRGDSERAAVFFERAKQLKGAHEKD